MSKVHTKKLTSKEKKTKRKLFEKATWTRNLTDLMEENPLADKNCKTCNGHGICEDGQFSSFGYIPINCPDCWK